MNVMSRAIATTALGISAAALVAGTASAAPSGAPAPAPKPVTAHAVDAPAAHDPVADFNAALGVAATNFGLATGIGGMVGGVAGLAGGCGLGATVGVAVMPEMFFTTGPAGCLVGVGIGGTIGPIVGGALLGIPVGVASAVQMYNTLHAAGDISAPLTVATVD